MATLQTTADAEAGGVAADGRLAYRCRASVLEGESTWQLTAEGLARSEGGGPKLWLPYHEVKELRLCYDPTRFDSRKFRCDLRTRTGARATIKSMSYVSIGEFEDRGASYTPFVRRLAQEIARASPACRFLAGKRAAVYLAEHAFLLSMVLVLAAVLAITAEYSLSGLVALKLSILACYLPIAWLYAKRNWPRRFVPPEIPPQALPPA